MTGYVSQQYDKLLEAPDSADAATASFSFSFQRGVTTGVLLQFLDPATGAPVLLPTGTQITFFLKPAGQYEADALAACGHTPPTGSTDFAVPGDASGFYTASLNCNTGDATADPPTGLNGLLLTPDGNKMNDLASVAVMIVLAWLIPGEANPHSVIVANGVVYNMGVTGSEGVSPASVPGLATQVATLQAGIFTNLPQITAYTGGTTGCLDAVAIAPLAAGTVLLFFNTALGALQAWVALAGTVAANAPFIVHTTDYDASTNAKYLKQLL